MSRFMLPFAASAAILAAATLPAAAHASLEKTEAAPGYFKAVVTISHGCDGHPTKSVRVDIPEGFIAAKPMPKAGWTIEIETGDYAHAYTMHGKPVTSGATAVIWKGDLPDAYFDTFALMGMFADVKPGQRLFFKTTQSCEEGKLAWTEEPAPGQNPHSLDHPAPFVTIIAGDAHGMHMSHGAHMDHASPAKAATAGELSIEGGRARAMLPGQPTGAAYLTVVNNGKEPDRLVSVTSPAAGKVEIHEMKTENGVMKMRAVQGGLDIPAGGSVELAPGGLHMMFMDVKEPFKEGGNVPVTLEFEKAGKVELSLPVGPASGMEEHMGHGKG